MKLMARKVQLESKNFRQQLLNEQKKGKEVMLKLEKARLEISGYRKLEEYTVSVTMRYSKSYYILSFLARHRKGESSFLWAAHQAERRHRGAGQDRQAGEVTGYAGQGHREE